MQCCCMCFTWFAKYLANYRSFKTLLKNKSGCKKLHTVRLINLFNTLSITELVDKSAAGLHTSVNLSSSFTCALSVTSTNMCHQSIQCCNTKTFLSVLSHALGDKARMPSRPTLPSSLSNTKSKLLLVVLNILHDAPTSKSTSISLITTLTT